jgi:phosphoribosylglycinamide formyltransferase 1
MRIGVLASHEGSVLQAVLDACVAGELCGSIALVISNNSSSGALRRARAAQIRALHLSSATHREPQALDRAIVAALDEARVDLVLLAGYMKQLGPQTLARYRRRIINTHPALLPRFGGVGMYGRRVHEAVLASGESTSGATVHWVEGEYDSGPILAQTTVPIDSGETAASLEAKVKIAERRLLLDTLAQLSQQSYSCAAQEH